MIDNERERDAFARLSTEDRSLALFNMIRSVRGDIANFKRDFINFQNDSLNYRKIRAVQELDTNDKIEAVLEKRFDITRYFVDKIIPNVITVITLGILYLVFGPK